MSLVFVYVSTERFCAYVSQKMEWMILAFAWLALIGAAIGFSHAVILLSCLREEPPLRHIVDVCLGEACLGAWYAMTWPVSVVSRLQLRPAKSARKRRSQTISP